MKVLINENQSKNMQGDVILSLINSIESADPQQRVKIENQIVKLGRAAVPSLLEELEVAKGVKRAIITMALIRIGKSSLSPLKSHFGSKSEFTWVVNYIENEINGSQVPLGKFKQVLVG